ncbi:histidinol-phosphatase [Clostridiales bacterium]|nr:histidinol-phosphatase [Clostridiales bacterium]
MINSDFHIHSTYCDGKNTLLEIAEAAEKKGLNAIGFSGHAYTPFDKSYCMSMENTLKYIEEAKRLKAEYAGRMEVYLGIEMDIFSQSDLADMDYVIGSVHYVLKDGHHLPVDESEKLFLDNINEYYDGDVFRFCEDYYKEITQLASVDEVDIIGHLDLLNKFNEGGRLFDIHNKRYETAINEAIYNLAAREKILEINTGAMARGYRSRPYPDMDILKKWNSLGGEIIFSSDAHSIDGLCYKFDEAEKIAKSCGFSKAVIFSGGELKEFSF